MVDFQVNFHPKNSEFLQKDFNKTLEIWFKPKLPEKLLPCVAGVCAKRQAWRKYSTLSMTYLKSRCTVSSLLHCTCRCPRPWRSWWQPSWLPEGLGTPSPRRSWRRCAATSKSTLYSPCGKAGLVVSCLTALEDVLFCLFFAGPPRLALLQPRPKISKGFYICQHIPYLVNLYHSKEQKAY